MTLVQDPVETPQRAPSRALDAVIKVLGVLLSVVAAVLSGFLELILTPLRAGGIPLCVAIPAAVVGNYALAWFAYTTVGRRWALGPPWIVWTLLMLFAAGVRTDEGDYLLSGNNWVALVMILAGSLTFALYTYRLILQRGAVTHR